jgi:hypothetical protein
MKSRKELKLNLDFDNSFYAYCPDQTPGDREQIHK